jgi:predicted TIM-barrel fold metal-dependent hydrolase
MLHLMGLSINLQLFPEQALAATQIVGRFPSTTLILNHELMPTLHDKDQRSAWRNSLAMLAEQENVAIKEGGFSTTNANLVLDDVTRAVADILDEFGVDRVMVGTNSPVESTRNSSQLFIDSLRAALSSLSRWEAEAVAAGTARRGDGKRTYCIHRYFQ